jgi:hypothetical protein
MQPVTLGQRNQWSSLKTHQFSLRSTFEVIVEIRLPHLLNITPARFAFCPVQIENDVQFAAAA